MEFNDLINELLEELDNDLRIIKYKKLKQDLLKDNKLLSEIAEYKNKRSIEKKQNLFLNDKYKEYLSLENEINLLILSIKRKLNILNNKRC